ncbi:melatonin receptor type 1A-A-like [Physella acuta]|uniref:melatonin receptor type 1A-A-like n=1 Tax=Physella acuta TaxID=109671 RepID=UPI0027DD51AF|nr:melatonin receptor type 1A-A-like [Physella acuta]
MSMQKASNISTTAPPVRAVVDLIDYETSRVAFLLVVPLGFVVQLLGAVTNGINVVVFFKVGLKDVVSVSFFALSLSDLFFTIISSILTEGNIILYIIYYRTLWSRDVKLLGDFVIWYSVIFKDSTLLFTTYIAIARCCLVTFPLQFKTTFTLRRTYYALSGIFIGNLFLHLPILFTQGLMWAFDLKTNTTRLVLWETPDVKTTLAFHDLVNRNVIPYVCYSVIFICLIVLYSKLVSATKFRQRLRNDAAKTSSKLSPRDVRVVKAVFFVSLFYLVCFVPVAVLAFFHFLFPEFSYGKLYNNTYNFVFALSTFISPLNSTFNIAFYLKYNTKFRETVMKCRFCYTTKIKK